MRFGDLSAIDWVGGASSAILFATLTAQVWRQYRGQTHRGVPHAFFIGQVLASSGFILYSLAIGNVIFLIANTLILASALAGYLVTVGDRSSEAGRIGRTASGTAPENEARSPAFTLFRGGKSDPGFELVEHRLPERSRVNDI